MVAENVQGELADWDCGVPLREHPAPGSRRRRWRYLAFCQVSLIKQRDTN